MGMERKIPGRMDQLLPLVVGEGIPY
jgi:hypothetical protein